MPHLGSKEIYDNKLLMSMATWNLFYTTENTVALERGALQGDFFKYIFKVHYSHHPQLVWDKQPHTKMCGICLVCISWNK